MGCIALFLCIEQQWFKIPDQRKKFEIEQEASRTIDAMFEDTENKMMSVIKEKDSVLNEKDNLINEKDNQLNEKEIALDKMTKALE